MADKKTLDQRKADWTAKLVAMTEGELRAACNQYIWLSAYATNNPKSDYHWMADACHDECERRGTVDEVYQAEWRKLATEARTNAG